MLITLLAGVPVAASSSVPKVAVCLVGELRSVDLTGPTLRTHLLDHWRADAFVSALASETTEPNERMRLEGVFGPRLKAIELDLPSALLDEKLLRQTIAAPAQARTQHFFDNGSRTDLSRKQSEQWLNRRRCRELVLAEEVRRGVPYEAYARVRLDTWLFMPMPLAMLQAVLKGDAAGAEAGFARAEPSFRAVVPVGNDFGPCPSCAASDKLLLGGAAAFAADANVHESMIDGALPVLHDVWLPEVLHKAHLTSRAVAVARLPLAFCILSTAGECRYPEELLRSETILEEAGWTAKVRVRPSGRPHGTPTACVHLTVSARARLRSHRLHVDVAGKRARRGRRCVRRRRRTPRRGAAAVRHAGSRRVRPVAFPLSTTRRDGTRRPWLLPTGRTVPGCCARQCGVVKLHGRPSSAAAAAQAAGPCQWPLHCHSITAIVTACACFAWWLL